MHQHIKNIKENIFPGFVVSLIALPLSLGLALASGVPPIAGIITAVVGGILVSVLGGSHITITGPGNGLVVATLSAVTILGAGNMAEGYLYTLAAVICSGVMMYLFGLLRFGALSDFFPTAAVQGMLAAIGLIIMAKQLHVMLGEVSPEASGTAALFATLPATLFSLFRGELPMLAYAIGALSLAIMILYSVIRNRFLHLIPAPMWIVLIAIGVTYFSQKYPHTLQPLPSEYLINIPENFWDDLSFPNFGKVGHFDFWVAVFTLTLISSMESLLSIKAVDKLDPKHRRSNANKDLRALGIATMASGALGGLNVVSVIARSSVNVNNGATTRWSNFFHGAFLLVFLLVFTQGLQHISLPALASILVYTGYKLASPAVFRRILKVGWIQLAIFLITLITTIFTNLISGIVAGILATIIFQIWAIDRAQVLLRYTFRPNTLLYRETDGQYLLSVKAFSNFLNFLGVKKKLDSIPFSSKVILDFSLAKFVDYSVMEQLQGYQQNFKNAGGDLEIIGLDDMGTTTKHPLAPRLTGRRNKKDSQLQLSHRQKALRLFSKKLDWRYASQKFQNTIEFESFKYFETRVIDTGRNQVQGKVGDIDILMADLDYHEGEFIARESIHSTMVMLTLNVEIPSFVMDKENLLDKVAHLAGFDDINFAMHPDFSKTFNVKGKDRKAVIRFLDDEMIDFLQANKTYHIESNGKALLIFEKERLSILSEIKQLVSFASRLSSILNSKLYDECLD
ncbi:SulP family inorganic anion transporter [Owenweeksia hongkongensis]|uniref:SulP family inorganic anion transporter n=1 Tax=Owenweeksia hongkongensis TaxID=253245 RepID=UPI003A9262BF